ncbi:hypothetical protein [Streptomyces griseoaurantiacus]|jgi:hypothetical protein|uniref:hypothetical protein n=1 Tax=Streptomyces griseoaurantiacus TaxID=68213 RepID=UPI0032432224
MLTADGKLKFPTKKTGTMEKQVTAANGTPVVWCMSDERTRWPWNRWVLENNVKGIKFVFQAGAPQ